MGQDVEDVDVCVSWGGGGGGGGGGVFLAAVCARVGVGDKTASPFSMLAVVKDHLRHTKHYSDACCLKY